jgi:hypothetical protein
MAQRPTSAPAPTTATSAASAQETPSQAQNLPLGTVPVANSFQQVPASLDEEGEDIPDIDEPELRRGGDDLDVPDFLK